MNKPVYGMPPELKQGEIWLVNFNPAIGTEIQKVRPAIVISSDNASSESVRLVVPITGLNHKHIGVPWIVRIDPDAQNGLEKPSVANPIMTRSMTNSVERFKHRMGKLEDGRLRELLAALTMVTQMKS